MTKVVAVEADCMVSWEALAANRSDDTATVYDAAKWLAAPRGIAYRPASKVEAVALMGIVRELVAAVSAVLDDFCNFIALPSITVAFLSDL